MKRFYLFVLLPFISLPVLAATKNKISMVTYFPVPYVAYSQVNTTEQMDIGLTNTCDMKLGCSEESATLNATRVNLKGGKLNLDGGRGIKGYTLNLGNGSGEGKISFQNVRIQAGNMESVNAKDMKVSALKLFGKPFPSCKEKDSSGQMQWTSLKLKGAESKELYLACGGLGESTEPEEDCSVRSYKLANKSKCCPGTPTSDGDCWLAPSYEWGAKKNFSGTFTVTFFVDPIQTCYDAAYTNPNVYRKVLPREAQWPVMNCGERNNANKPSLSCGPTHTPDGVVFPTCYYTVDVPATLGHDYDIYHTGCKKLSDTECECTASRWPGHECVEKPAQKNGW